MTNEEQVLHALKNELSIDNIDESSVCVECIDLRDHPDYVDAYIASAAFINGDQLTESDLDWLNEQCEFIYSAIQRQVF